MSKLVEWRKAKGLKQQEAANFLGIRKRSLIAYERDETKPSFAIRNLLADRTKQEVPVDSWDE